MLVAVALLLSVLPLVYCFLQTTKKPPPNLAERRVCDIVFRTAPPISAKVMPSDVQPSRGLFFRL